MPTTVTRTNSSGFVFISVFPLPFPVSFTYYSNDISVSFLRFISSSNNMATGARKSYWMLADCGVFINVRLFHELIKTVPERSNSLVFLRHSEYFFEFSVQAIGR
ncbi:hypothetical protein E1B28_012265 [Marasmius oreades]|uniref:Uncharacterized protein n=1 Tax=Marasmius oreades TaxID=181124 RepID=A0A9P7RS51_9AGAR|nr:uncharacterized protein E1B28_012265 [Marasmius oreades]KAG7088251.1 hypothetical protein E1B28_012265 [Marasmius oreades]